MFHSSLLGLRALFVLLSLADLGLTCWLLVQSGGQIYESNPVASWWLTNAGWFGLVFFKVGSVLLVLTLATVIHQHRPWLGGSILGFGCTVLALVVFYSGHLAIGLAESKEPATIDEVERAVDAMNRDLVEVARLREAYWRLRERLATALISQEYSLSEAVDRLGASERLRDPSWLRALPGYGGHSLRACLAMQLLAAVSVKAGETPGVRETIARMEDEFQALHGDRPPRHKDLPPG
jgi:hypothetical protein